MKSARVPPTVRGLLIAALIFVQVLCVGFFVMDLAGDLARLPLKDWFTAHQTMELFANLGLAAGIMFETTYLVRLLRRQAHAERALSVASGALHEVMEGYFAEWNLTPSEADVAAFTIKGYGIAEIAGLRGSAEGTVKTHLNAIYRKSGLSGRGQLVSILIEDLLTGTLPERDGK
jgi:DNA-binding CsgD family transcriptional regulator